MNLSKEANERGIQNNRNGEISIMRAISRLMVIYIINSYISLCIHLLLL